MQIKILNYRTTDRAAVQAFVDVLINDTWRVNGINLLRTGGIKAGQLTPLVNNRRCYIDSIQVIDGDLRESLIAAIQTAIRLHIESLPLEQRVKPPRPPEPRQANQQPAAATVGAKPQTALVQDKPASPATPAAPVKPKPIHTKPPAVKAKLPLLANFPRTTP
jgi:hypothetical protein